LFIFYPWIPESPRFLLNKGNFKKAVEVISSIREQNGDEKIEDLEEVLMTMVDAEENSKMGILSLFKERSIFKLFTCIVVLYIVNDYFYMAGQLNATNLAGNMFVNFSLLALTELPVVFIGQAFIDRFGRRWSHVGIHCITTSLFLVNVLIVNMDGMGTAVLVLSLLAKFFGNITWFIMWVQSIEAFPTSMRNTGINMSSSVSMLVGMTAPFFLKMHDYDKRLPYIGFCILGVAGFIAAFFVPETKDISLPESTEHLDEIYRNMRYFELRPWTRKEEKNEKKIDG